jgi:hypothetical protein
MKIVETRRKKSIYISKNVSYEDGLILDMLSILLNSFLVIFQKSGKWGILYCVHDFGTDFGKAGFSEGIIKVLGLSWGVFRKSVRRFRSYKFTPSS